MTDKEYRSIDRDSNSSLKDFIEDRKDYHKKWVIKEEVSEKKTKALTGGGLVDTLLYSPTEFDDRFSLTATQKPKPQMLSFVEALYDKSVDCMADDGSLTRSMETLTKEAYNQVKFNRAGDVVAFKTKTLEKVLDDFTDTDVELYYRQLMNSKGKITVELYEVQNAERTVKELKNNWVTKFIINLATDKKRYETYEQFAILFEYKGLEMKALLDKMIVDHELKEITPWDLKTCWDNEKEFQSNWYRYKYYIQAAVYYLACLFWAKKEGWEGYKINPMKFIVADSNNYQNPLIYETDLINLQQGIEGFTLGGRYHPGVNWAVENILWHKEKNIWEISKENYENAGIVKIKPFIEDEY